MSEQVQISLTCRICEKNHGKDVDEEKLEMYLKSNDNVDLHFPVDEYDWTVRDVIIGHSRKVKKRWNAFYVCPYCMVQGGMAEVSELPPQYSVPNPVIPNWKREEWDG